MNATTRPASAVNYLRRFHYALNAVVLRRRGKDAFARHLPSGSRLFDIGCGNDSAARVKALRPDLYYIGLDISDYNNSVSPETVADTYLTCKASDFASAIANCPGRVDAIISAHNIEHCDEPYAVAEAMARKLNPSGKLYIAFPSAASVGFPSREGGLNFWDDPTHKNIMSIPKLKTIFASHGLACTFIAQNYKPLPLRILGALLEPYARLTRKRMPFAATWALYGFETVIWAEKASAPAPA